MIIRSLIAATLLVLSTGAYGQYGSSTPDNGFYFNAKGGYSVLGNSSVHGLGTGNTLRFKGGYDVSGSIGYSFPLTYVRWSNQKPASLRLEFESGYTDNSLSSLSLLGTTVSVSGSIETLRFMVNTFLDVPLSERLYASIGGGIGYSRIRGSSDDITIGPITLQGTSGTSDEFAWQVGAGIGYVLTEHISLEAGYRLFSFGDPNIASTSFEAPLVHLFSGGIQFRF